MSVIRSTEVSAYMEVAMYGICSIGNSSRQWFSVHISEVSVTGGVCYRRFHCISIIVRNNA